MARPSGFGEWEHVRDGEIALVVQSQSAARKT
jgi:hypothetical protein